jgi:hypothetical protein
MRYTRTDNNNKTGSHFHSLLSFHSLGEIVFIQLMFNKQWTISICSRSLTDWNWKSNNNHLNDNETRRKERNIDGQFFRFSSSSHYFFNVGTQEMPNSGRMCNMTWLTSSSWGNKNLEEMHICLHHILLRRSLFTGLIQLSNCSNIAKSRLYTAYICPIHLRFILLPHPYSK